MYFYFPDYYLHEPSKLLSDQIFAMTDFSEDAFFVILRTLKLGYPELVYRNL